MVWWATDATDDIQTEKEQEAQGWAKGDWGEATESEKTQQ